MRESLQKRRSQTSDLYLKTASSFKSVIKDSQDTVSPLGHAVTQQLKYSDFCRYPTQIRTDCVFQAVSILVKYNGKQIVNKGGTQIRTGDKGFAILCLTTWPCRRIAEFQYIKFSSRSNSDSLLSARFTFFDQKTDIGSCSHFRQQLLNHAIGLSAVTTAKQVEVIENVIEVIKYFSGGIAQ